MSGAVFTRHLTWGQTMVGVMVTSSKKTYVSMPHLPRLLCPCPWSSGRPLSTHSSARDSQTLISKPGSVSCVVTATFSWVLMHTRFFFFFFPPRVSVSPVLWKLCNQIPLTFKVRFPEDSQSFCWILRLGSLLWGLELLQQWENLFGIIVLQFVEYPPSGSIVWLMVTSSKRTCATSCAPQNCCCKSPCPHALQETFKHLQAGLTWSLVCGGVTVLFLGSGCTQGFFFVPSKHLWQVWGLILNGITPLLLPYCCISFALGYGVLCLSLVGSNILWMIVQH